MIFRLSGPFLAGSLLFLSICAGWAHGARAQDDYHGLPDAPGREEVAIYCGACHSLMIVVQQGLDRDSWDKLLVWMVEEQGMPELEPGDHKLILDYLAEHVGPDSHEQRLRDSGIRR